jgi:quinol-cytochrome oxidoreductase complex cytochrome b subunit
MSQERKSLSQKDRIFYTELVITTIFSLVAASLWIELIKQSISCYFPSSHLALGICAIILTLFAIFGLHWAFSESKKNENN